MDVNTRLTVAARADYTCEYCRFREVDDVYLFHVEHIIALQHGGSSDLQNLAYSCQHYNLRKGPNLSGIDPLSGEIVRLFHPRQQAWTDHFRLHDGRIVGITATVQVLAMNALDRVALRLTLA